MAVIANSLTATAGQLRPFDVRKDLNSVADLIELCFADTLDPDGERYLRQMRDAARSVSFLRWASSAADVSIMPLSGYVWEEDGKVVGNLSLIPFSIWNQRYYLIANVAVLPEYRRQGIARALTSMALEQSRRKKAAGAWLHVREENDAAIRLYLSLGFNERARRTTYHNNRNGKVLIPNEPVPDSEPLVILPRRSHTWPQQSAWLRSLYPPELTWHLPLNFNILRPGLLGGLYGLINGTITHHWVAQRGDRLVGAITWQSFNGYNDYLWLAVPPILDDAAIQALLLFIRQRLPAHRQVNFDFPARVASQAIQSAGFTAHQTLIWMVVDNYR